MITQILGISIEAVISSVENKKFDDIYATYSLIRFPENEESVLLGLSLMVSGRISSAALFCYCCVCAIWNRCDSGTWEDHYSKKIVFFKNWWVKGTTNNFLKYRNADFKKNTSVRLVKWFFQKRLNPCLNFRVWRLIPIAHISMSKSRSQPLLIRFQETYATGRRFTGKITTTL